ncbi:MULTISPECIES: class I SAM-dependent methyltransferase [Aquimarina]|uniref:Class I SAM-dependent methyltransferase n=1 Tax=Aquimarina algiphila TaxID=2047982 RepID=A0A554VQR4_9FLAO|nr:MULTISPECIES: class I SAM-dependent methyltransferase [Aquimarina]TSE10874.1 class I SAM-dependent methyltransferase [Aquimarina algiphila]
MNEAFDIAAIAYDDVFTHSHIGKYQRELVYYSLAKTLSTHKNLNILEINCGTGHDAIWLANKGHRILATDISSQMITIAKTKLSSNQNQLEFRQLDINALNETHFDDSFDLIFSNFGGLNCLSPIQLHTFFNSASKILKPEGKIIGVIMPKNCLFENIYFILKRNFKNVFRRNTKNSIAVNVDGNLVKTWYYNPKNIRKFSKNNFRVNKVRPIGFFIPPSYLEPFFKKKLGLLRLLNRSDRIVKHFSFLSKYSDHYLISLQSK